MEPKQQVNILPFLKWAGGKRWLPAAYPELLNCSFERYIEPFLGSAAVFFFLAPKNAILSDKNSDLIATYQSIKDNWRQVKTALDRHEKFHSAEHYYATRDSMPRAKHTKAARFIYLNRTCWNGLYRVNQKGEFNVPIGTKDKVLLKTDDFEGTSKLLQRAELIPCDFEHTVNMASASDLVFIDPPYTVKHNLNGFVKYNENLFSWEDQERLRDAVLRAIKRGATVIVSNANHKSVQKLYKGITQASFVEALVKFLSEDPIRDRNDILNGNRLKVSDEKKCPFAKFFRAGQSGDLVVYDILYNYFDAVRTKWPVAWDDLKPSGNLLPKSNAFKALMRYLKDDVYLELSKKVGKDVPSTKDFLTQFDHVDLTDQDFTTKNFAPGSGGQSAFYKVLCGAMKANTLFFP